MPGNFVATNLLFFSRGRGHGHAIRDIALSDSLTPILPELSITFVSYSTGATVFRRAQRPLIDLELPEENGFTETLLRADDVLRGQQPDVVLAHEEFGAVAAAKLHRLPCIYLSSWLPPPGTAYADVLTHADAIYTFSEPGMFPALPRLPHRPRFTGPLLRSMTADSHDRGSARRELGIATDAFVVTVIPGGWATESRCPLAPLLLPAFSRLEVDRALIWLAGSDIESVSAAVKGHANVRALPYVDRIEAIISGSDLVITKGNRGATLEAEELGVPSLSVSFGTNRIDDILISSVKSNVALEAAGLDWRLLLDYLERASQRRLIAVSARRGTANARRTAIAVDLAHDIRRVLRREPPDPQTRTEPKALANEL